MNSDKKINWYLWTDGKNDYRLFDNPPNEPQGFSYDFTSLNDALNFAKQEELRVIYFGKFVDFTDNKTMKG